VAEIAIHVVTDRKRYNKMTEKSVSLLKVFVEVVIAIAQKSFKLKDDICSKFLTRRA
jgi:hypothetical protein